MFCVYCGKEIEDGSRFCPYCGASVQIEQENTAHGGSAVSNDLEKGKVLKKRKIRSCYCFGCDGIDINL